MVCYMRFLLFINVLMWSAAGDAEIYKWTDAAGRVHYSDNSPEGSSAERMERGNLPYVHQQQPLQSVSPVVRSGPRASSNGPVRRLVPGAPARASLEECIQVKRRAVLAEKRDRKQGAPDLESWLWKHCRPYSNELRKVSQSMM